MRPWKKMTNEELSTHIELWLGFGNHGLDEYQMECFREVCWRLALMRESADG